MRVASGSIKLNHIRRLVLFSFLFKHCEFPFDKSYRNKTNIMIRLNSRVPYTRLGNLRPSCDARIVIKVLFVVAIITLLALLFTRPELRNGRPCFELSPNVDAKSILFFPDILDHPKKPAPSKTIFFLETSCSGDGNARLNARYTKRRNSAYINHS